MTEPSIQYSETSSTVRDASLLAPFVETHYPWPGWDQRLGPAPLIEMSGPLDKAYVEQLNQVLTRVAQLSRETSAEALANQLKELSGIPIQISPTVGLPHTEANSMRHAPILEFDPRAWERYPVEGGVPLPRHAPEQPDAPRRYTGTEYAIAPPEQLLLNEMGRYAMHYKAHASFEKFEQTGDANHLVQVGKYSAFGNSPRYAIDHYENPSMQSAFGDFKLRDAARAGEASLLYAGENGVPVVAESDKEALAFALKVHRGAEPVRERPLPAGHHANPAAHDVLGRADAQSEHMAEAFLQYQSEAVLKVYPELRDAYVILETLKHGIGQSGMAQQEQMVALAQVKTNLADRITEGRLPTLPQERDMAEQHIERV